MSDRGRKHKEFWREVHRSPRPRIVHVPRNIGGNAKGLSDAMRSLGASSFSISFARDSYGFSADLDTVDDADSIMVSEFRRFAMIPRILAAFDVIHYNAGLTISMPSTPPPFMLRRLVSPSYLMRLAHSLLTSFMEVVELTLARSNKLQLFVTFQGDDARQGDESRRLFEESIARHVGDEYYSTASDRFKRRRIRRLERHGVRMFALNPDLLHVLPDDAHFIPYTNAGTTGAAKNRTGTDSVAPPTKLKIVHAPSHRAAKGTDVVEAALYELQSEGFDFEFILVENTPNSKARRVIEGADLLVDQLYAGWYGGVAVEAMNAGVPVMCYIRENDLDFIPPEMRRDLPVMNVTAEILKVELAKFLSSTHEERGRMSERCREFVEVWHSSTGVAGELLSTYRVGLMRSDQMR